MRNLQIVFLNLKFARFLIGGAVKLRVTLLNLDRREASKLACGAAFYVVLKRYQFGAIFPIIINSLGLICGRSASSCTRKKPTELSVIPPMSSINLLHCYRTNFIEFIRYFAAFRSI